MKNLTNLWRKIKSLTFAEIEYLLIPLIIVILAFINYSYALGFIIAVILLKLVTILIYFSNKLFEEKKIGVSVFYSTNSTNGFKFEITSVRWYQDKKHITAILQKELLERIISETEEDEEEGLKIEKIEYLK